MVESNVLGDTRRFQQRFAPAHLEVVSRISRLVELRTIKKDTLGSL
jgi:hypothetical protein